VLFLTWCYNLQLLLSKTIYITALLKTYGNIVIVYNNLSKVRIWAKRDIQKIGKLIIKALAAFAEDCLSLRSKRVPQALQVLYEFDTVIRIIFGGAKAFWLLFGLQKVI